MMKQLKTLVIAAAIAFFGTQTINAQAKVAHVDVNELMSKMPAMLEAQGQLKKLSETYDKDYKTMVDEYQVKIKKYDTEASTVSEAINQTRQTEVQDMIKRINDFKETAQSDLQKKEGDLMKPLLEKVKASIQKVGKLKGYQYVLNATDLLLTDETSRYVFRILALKEIMKAPAKYGFAVNTEQLYVNLPTKKLEIDSSINDLARFAKSQGINYKILKIHNPWLRDKKLVNLSRKKYEIQIPLSGY